MENKHPNIISVVDDVVLTENLSVLGLSDGMFRIIESRIESYMANSLEEAVRIFKTNYLDQMPMLMMTTILLVRRVVDALKCMPVSKECPSLRSTTIDFCPDVRIGLTLDTEEHSLSYWVNVRVPRILVNGQYATSVSRHFMIQEEDLVEEASSGDEIARSVVEKIMESDMRRVICQVVYYHMRLGESYRALQEYARKQENQHAQ